MFLSNLLDQTAVVYTPHATTGDYTVAAKSDLACRLVRMTMTTTPTGERVELAGKRVLVWDKDYTMPETAQVLIDGKSWNIQAGSVDYPRGVTSQVEYGRADVIEAGS